MKTHSNTHIVVAITSTVSTASRPVLFRVVSVKKVYEGRPGHTSLGWTEILARSWRARASTTSLLDRERTALVDLALQSLLGGIGLLSRHHLNEAEASALASVWVAHDVALLDLSVLLKQARDLVFGQAWVDTSDEQVGSWVDGLAVAIAATAAAVLLSWSLVTLFWSVCDVCRQA